MSGNDPRPDRQAYIDRRNSVWFSDRRPAGRVARGANYLHRPGEVLVATKNLTALRGRLSDASARRHDTSDELAARFGVERWTFADDIPVQEFVSHARAVDGAGEVAAIAPNHVLAGAQHFMFGPSSPPEPTGPLSGQRAPVDRRAQIAVFDTGVAPHLRTLHPALADHVAGDRDRLDRDGDGRLDVQAGHGTFVASVVNRVLPEASVTVHRVLDADGLGDELELALALVSCTAPVVNLSLYCYTHFDVPPLLLTAAIDALPRDTAIIASAGNDNTDRPAWPAAHKRVVAVGATDQAAAQKAEFSNFGWWVDCGAPGVDIRGAYVDGVYELGDDVRFSGWASWSGTSFSAPQVAAAVMRRALDDGVSARQAAYRILGDELRPDVPGLGTVVLPPIDLTGDGAASVPLARHDSETAGV